MGKEIEIDVNLDRDPSEKIEITMTLFQAILVYNMLAGHVLRLEKAGQEIEANHIREVAEIIEEATEE